MVEVSQNIAPAPGGGLSKVPVKLYGIIGATALFGLIAGLFLNAGILVQGSVMLAVFITSLTLETLFIRAQGMLTIAVGIGAFVFALPFFRLFSVYFMAAVLVLVLFVVHGSYQGRREMERTLKIRFSRVAHVVTTSVVTALVIFLSAVLIISSNFTIKEERVDQIVRIASPVVARFIDNFTPDATARSVIANVVEKSAKSDPRFSTFTDYQKQQVIASGVLQMQNKLENSIGTQINLDTSITQNIHRIVETKLNSLTPQAQVYWSILAIAVIWISVRSVEFIIYVPLAILTFLIYELLLSLGFAVIQMETVSKEVISLK